MPLPSAKDNQNGQNHIATPESNATDSVSSTGEAEDMNQKIDNANNDNDAETAETQMPEPKITLTSPSPDIAIATLETPNPETQIAIKVLNSEPQHENNSDLQLEDASQPEEVVVKENLYTASPTNDAAQDTASQDIDEENETPKTAILEKEEEKVVEKIIEKKEAKLESYKQFVAEQFNHKKIDYPEVRISIEANALPSKMYFVMNFLSAIIASYGLIANSVAVVIGAMLVAMMLGPITGVALAIIDYRMPLLRKSLFTVAAGISLVIFVGYIVGWLHQGEPLTAEVLSRTQPTSMDLMIALAGGTAGAYAMVSPNLSVAVVGVAVATALVPPLAASGILFANGEGQLGLGALLLAITNIIAIQFTNAMVLWFLGFRRLVDDDYKSNTFFTFLRRNAVTVLLLIGLGVYLTINLNTSARQQTFENHVKQTISSYFESKGNVLTNTQFDKADGKQIIRAVIRGETTPSAYDVQQIEASITQDIHDNFPNYLPIKLQLQYLPVQVIESNPLIQDKLDKTDANILTN
ncbi:DUF389 domain-containing protein [Psychrobacter urativorans]|uniref:Exopolyphosphatase n=1 Tax=Psychrobacter urativorans TaxID=45610 RepID=A0A0M3V9E6_9GAMM|nr:DUF389 domain-containing protein [Psychrobacter urativorans]ALF60507.1 exopolyphosphatase [Psychrobacter urativorans]